MIISHFNATAGAGSTSLSRRSTSCPAPSRVTGFRREEPRKPWNVGAGLMTPQFKQDPADIANIAADSRRQVIETFGAGVVNCEATWPPAWITASTLHLQSTPSHTPTRSPHPL